ncbi:MAG TPA: YciI family protein [Gemmatimonadaceae bacterium]|nr:YciI family protein [Gemmatimonadaceae bacterium]
MRFLSIYKTVETNAPPTAEEMARMGELIEEATRAGWLIATEGCLPSALGARVRRSAEKVTVTDGPFAESKEVVAGFALLEAGSKEEAIELCRKFLAVAGEGECELRQLFEGEGCVEAEVGERVGHGHGARGHHA